MSIHREFVQMLGYDPYSYEFLGFDRDRVDFIELTDCYQTHLYYEICGMLERYAADHFRPRKARAKRLERLVKIFKTVCPNHLKEEEWGDGIVPF